MAAVKADLGLDRKPLQPDEEMVNPPSSQVLQTYIGYLLTLQGRYAEALEYLLRSLVYGVSSNSINIVALADIIWLFKQIKDPELSARLRKDLVSRLLVRASLSTLSSAIKSMHLAPTPEHFQAKTTEKLNFFIECVELAAANTFAYRYEEAIFWTKKALEISENDSTCLALLCKCYIAQDKFNEAVVTANKLGFGTADDSYTYAYAAYIKALTGQRSEFYKFIDKVRGFSTERHWNLFLMYAPDYVIMQQGFQPGRCSKCALPGVVDYGYFVHLSTGSIYCKKCQSLCTSSADFQYYDIQNERDFFEAHLDLRREEILGQNSVAQYLNQIAMMYLSEDIATTHFLVDKLQQTLGLKSTKRKGLYRCLAELSLAMCAKRDADMASTYYIGAVGTDSPYFGKIKSAVLFVCLINAAFERGLQNLADANEVYTLATENINSLASIVENTTKVRQMFHSDDIRLMREALFQARARLGMLGWTLGKQKEPIAVVETAFCDMLSAPYSCLTLKETIAVVDMLSDYYVPEEEEADSNKIANQVADWGVMVEQAAGKAETRRELAYTLLADQLEKYPDHPSIIQRMAIVSMALNEWDRAVIAWTQLRKLRNTIAIEENLWGDCYLNLKDLEKALDRYKRAFGKEATVASYWADAALVSYLVRDIYSALYGAHRAVRMDPNNPDMSYWKKLIAAVDEISRDPEMHDIREDRDKTCSFILMEAPKGIDHDIIGQTVEKLKQIPAYKNDRRAKRAETLLLSMIGDPFWVTRDITINIWDRSELLVCIRHTHRQAVMHIELSSGRMRRQEGSSISENDLKRLKKWFK
eukprot:TRINITY_DN4691_c0_g1_i1.p1 TRINITY_DN4691_c0_g1~~TRINITY_DN4691_c0_g1_i1.p1  ORF type:complete len:909 (-),score=188.11 TRINITY_DN4691_c0_g1_i1:120-2567(-)